MAKQLKSPERREKTKCQGSFAFTLSQQYRICEEKLDRSMSYILNMNSLGQRYIVSTSDNLPPLFDDLKRNKDGKISWEGPLFRPRV